MNKLSPHQIAAIRAILIAIFITAIVVTLALVPSAFAATQADWQFNEVARSLSGISYETLTTVVTGFRLTLAGLYLVTAALLLACLPRAVSLLAALALIGLPFTFNLIGTPEAAGYPTPWNTLLSGVVSFLGYLGIVGLLLLILLFPDGRFYPSRLRNFGLAGVLATLAGIAALSFAEEAWLLLIVILLATILLGVIGQVLRYRAAGSLQRRQSAGFLLSIVALPIWILFSFSDVWPFLDLVAGLGVMALLPMGLLLAARRGAWGEPPSLRPFAWAVTVTALAVVVAAGIWWRGSRPPMIDLSGLESVKPIPVLFDTDMGMDDISALLYLLQHPAVDLRAITVNGVAFAHCDPGVHNVLGLLEVAHAPQIPVSCGRETAYTGGHPAPDDFRRGADTLYGGQVTTGGRTEDPRPAAQLLADTVAAAPGEIVVIALGPLTNLAEAFQADPALGTQIKEIVIMGGAVDVPGNVVDGDPDNHVAEWNIFADPTAAGIVLASGAPLTLVPLDATNDVPFTRGFYERLRADALTRPAVFTYNLMYLNQWWLDGGMYWWDTLAAAAALDTNLLTLRDANLAVITDEGPETGRVIESPSGSPARVAVAADARRFEALFLAVLNRE